MDRAAFFASLRRRDSGVFGTSLSQSQVNGVNAVLDACIEYGCDLGQTAYILATAYGETGSAMKPLRESTYYTDPNYIERTFSAYRRQGLSGRQLARRPVLLANTVYGGAWGRKNLGNTKDGDGYRFRGAGIGQITGRRNFTKWGQRLGVNLINDPDWIMSLKNSVKALVSPMKEGWATGKRLDQYVSGDRRDYYGARAVWGGVHPQKYANYALSFQAALERGGYGSGSGADPVSRPQGNWLANLIAAIGGIFGKGKA